MPGGRPSKYKPIFCKKIIEFFSVEKAKQYIKSERITKKSNGTEEIFREYGWMPNDLPTFNRFARSIKVNEDTVVEWAKAVDKANRLKYPEFSASYNIAKQLQKEFLNDNALKGFHPPASYIFVAKNITDMRDKQDVDLTSKGKSIVGFNYLPPKKNGEDNPDNKA